MGNFTAVDIIVAVVILGLAMFSFFRGFVHQVLAIGAWVGAVAVTFYGFPLARGFFRSHIGSPLGADIATGAVLFLVSLLILSMVTKAVSDRVRRSALNSVDSSLGFVFGAIMGGAAVSLLYLLVASLAGQEQPDWLAEARTRPWLERGAGILRGMAPDGFGAAEQKTQAIGDDARDLMEAEQQFRQIVAPQPSGGVMETAPAPEKAGEKTVETKPAKPATKGYDKESRGQLDRLFQTNQ